MDRRTLANLLILSLALPGVALASGKKAEGGEGEKGKKKSDGSYLTVGLVTASIMRSNGRRSVLAIETGIDIPDPKLYEKASRLTPRLQAAYVQSVQIYAANLSPSRVPDADYISRELQRQTDMVVGSPGVRLLLGSIMVN